MTAPAAATVDARSLELERLDLTSERLVRLFRHPCGEWEAPEEK